MSLFFPDYSPFLIMWFCNSVVVWEESLTSLKVAIYKGIYTRGWLKFQMLGGIGHFPL